ncbi:uncharacterized protein Hap1MRO34_014553 [Clarias gariepinus]
MKSDYRSIKDHNSRSGLNRRSRKWFDQMDAIYGGRPTSNGREGALDSAMPLLLENTIEDVICAFPTDYTNFAFVHDRFTCTFYMQGRRPLFPSGASSVSTTPANTITLQLHGDTAACVNGQEETEPAPSGTSCCIKRDAGGRH